MHSFNCSPLVLLMSSIIDVWLSYVCEPPFTDRRRYSDVIFVADTGPASVIIYDIYLDWRPATYLSGETHKHFAVRVANMAPNVVWRPTMNMRGGNSS